MKAGGGGRGLDNKHRYSKLVSTDNPRQVSLRHDTLQSTVIDKAVNKLHSNVFRSKLTLRRLQIHLINWAHGRVAARSVIVTSLSVSRSVFEGRSVMMKWCQVMLGCSDNRVNTSYHNLRGFLDSYQPRIQIPLNIAQTLTSLRQIAATAPMPVVSLSPSLLTRQS